METNCPSNSQNLEISTQILQVLLDHQFLKNNRALRIEKMNSKEIYSIIISSKVNIPTS